MLLTDLNALVYAHRSDIPDHRRYRDWLESETNSDLAYGMSDLILSGFLRVVTHPRIFHEPSPFDKAFAFTNWD